MFRKKLLAVILGLSCIMTSQMGVVGVEDLFTGVGISPYLESGDKNYPIKPTSMEETLDINAKIELEQQRISEELAMANVSQALNVREEADENSSRVGMLYKDCGGTILDRVEGWIKIKSGDVVGWAKEDYMLTGEEAMAMAEEVGNWVALVEADAVRVRREPSLTADIWGLIGYDDILSIIEVVDESWISVEYGGDVGYVATDYVGVRYHIDEAETIESIRMREDAERERQRTANRGRVDASADELLLLAALIYTEAGNQPYEGKVGVGAVVMNRVRSGAYPNSIYAVIHASGQFPPAHNGRVARAYERGVPASCVQAAQAAIDGESTVGGAVRFRRAGRHDGIEIGDHVFW